MKRILLKYSPSGACISSHEVSANYTPKYDESILETDDKVSIVELSKEPVRSDLKRSLIKEKVKFLLSRDNYIFGLETGWKIDDKYKSWMSSLIKFSKSFENQTIEKTKITFPTDPWGNQEVLEL